MLEGALLEVFPGEDCLYPKLELALVGLSVFPQGVCGESWEVLGRCLLRVGSVNGQRVQEGLGELLRLI